MPATASNSFDRDQAERNAVTTSPEELGRDSCGQPDTSGNLLLSPFWTSNSKSTAFAGLPPRAGSRPGVPSQGNTHGPYGNLSSR